MSLLWKEAFTLGDFSWSNTNSFSDIIEITDLEALKHFLDALHVKFCLLKPWCETENYPLVDSRDLLPSRFFYGGVRPASGKFQRNFPI